MASPGHNRQQAALAAALASRAGLLPGEPAAGLDPPTADLDPLMEATFANASPASHARAAPSCWLVTCWATPRRWQTG